uniref:Uncharacterized protein n=1 Tax=Nelumbo nucifera TaxID=4432 RepID=A0A822ZLL5_NELNU|nr:TPA_asm: hypothetical protein HUJ06_004322 [Nelumbo nucifera]
MFVMLQIGTLHTITFPFCLVFNSFYFFNKFNMLSFCSTIFLNEDIFICLLFGGNIKNTVPVYFLYQKQFSSVLFQFKHASSSTFYNGLGNS